MDPARRSGLRLINLITGEKTGVTLTSDISELNITGLTADSRAVQPGFLFAALPGSIVDGREFTVSALEKGAVAILAPEGTNPPKDSVLITARDPRAALAHISAAFYGAQPNTIAAVTGTNGKTSVAQFTQQIWSKLGNRAATIGTLGIQMPDGPVKPSLTTPDPVTLQANLAELWRQNVTHAIVEASSHGLDQRRMDGVRLTVAAFTNLTREHLDYHGTFEHYFAAKERLFAELLPRDGVAILNADVPEFSRLSNLSTGQTISYGHHGFHLKLQKATPTHSGIAVKLTIMGNEADFILPFIGMFQVHNVLCAAGIAIGCGAKPTDVIHCLSSLESAPGRMQLVGTVSGGSVYVDYAHSPDALTQVLTAFRAHTRGRLISVMGCGGDRDPGKRSTMGSISAHLADMTIVTDDNPRHEDASRIRSQILAANPDALEIGDRAKAIQTAIAMINPADVVVITGKGHETGQIVGDETLPFNDMLVAKREMDEVRSENT